MEHVYRTCIYLPVLYRVHTINTASQRLASGEPWDNFRNAILPSLHLTCHFARLTKEDDARLTLYEDMLQARKRRTEQ